MFPGLTNVMLGLYFTEKWYVGIGIVVVISNNGKMYANVGITHSKRESPKRGYAPETQEISPPPPQRGPIADLYKLKLLLTVQQREGSSRLF